MLVIELLWIVIRFLGINALFVMIAIMLLMFLPTQFQDILIFCLEFSRTFPRHRLTLSSALSGTPVKREHENDWNDVRLLWYTLVDKEKS